MTKLVISKIKSPSGALAEVERVNINIANQLPVSSWLDAELADTLLAYHPVSVQKGIEALRSGQWISRVSCR